MTGPFRWNFDKREQLGSWIEDVADFHPPHPEDLESLRTISARILAMSDGASLAFIGRSPENFYDYLSGCLDGVGEAPPLTLVPFSMRWIGEGEAAAIPAHKFEGLKAALASRGLDPAAIAAGKRPVALVDMIAYGGTMEALIKVLHRMAGESGTDWTAVQRRLKIIGLRVRTKNSPNTWRWQQHQRWLDLIPDTVIKNISAPPGFIFLIANSEEKVTRSFHYGRWDSEAAGAEPPDEAQRRAMALAAWLYDLGHTREERHRLSRLIAACPEMKQAATRALVSRLRRG
ncbi:hypothetical protein [Henriciella aquimarina]|uniref:hypothetical protein n=1 Tax=Henriciella aquimarina TaxID=545261 RepID=UPI0009FBC316|nr:hypothetical protein [Henriciella aquimarina]